MPSAQGVLALIGGDEWTQGCEFDAELLERSGGTDVVVLPTAAAFEQPERRVIEAASWFERFSAQVEGLMVTTRHEAHDAAIAARVAAARFIYLSGGSALHLRSVLKETPVFEAIRSAYEQGAVLAAAGAAAMVLSDPMVDPRGGAPTVGLGPLTKVAVVSHYGDEHEDQHGEKMHRSEVLFGGDVMVVGLPVRCALIRDDHRAWTTKGSSDVVGYLRGERIDDVAATLTALGA